MFSDICFEIKEVLAEDKKNYLYSDPLKFSDSLLDVDIVIPIENYPIFIKNLEEILIKSAYLWRRVDKYQNKFHCESKWFVFDQTFKSCLQLDIKTGYCWAGVFYLSYDFSDCNAKSDLTIQYCKDMISMGSVKKDRKHLRRAQLGWLFRKFFNHNFELQIGQYHLLFKVCLFATSLISNPIKAFSGMINLFRNKHLDIIAFTGVDGSGKTTLINSLNDSLLVSLLYKSVTYRHTKPGYLPALSFFSPTKNKKPKPNRSLKKLSTLSASFYFLYYSIDYILFRLLMIFSFKRDALIIFDRYFFEFLYQDVYEKLPSKLKTLSNYFYQPDLSIFLIGDHELLAERKKEMSSKDIKSQIIKILLLADNYEKSLVIDTTRKNIESSVTSLQKELL